MGLANDADGCVFRRVDGECLSLYLDRMARELGALLETASDDLETAQGLLPVHSKILAELLNEFRQEYRALIHVCVHQHSDADSSRNWSAIVRLRLSPHVYPELCEAIVARFQRDVCASTTSFDALSGTIHSTVLSIFADAQLPQYLCDGIWTRLQRHFRMIFVKARSQSLFEDVLDFPESEERLRQLGQSLMPGDLELVAGCFGKS